MDKYSFYSELVEMLSTEFGREFRNQLEERLESLRQRRRNHIEKVVDEDSYDAVKSPVLALTAKIKTHQEILTHFFDLEGLKETRDALKEDEIKSQD